MTATVGLEALDQHPSLLRQNQALSRRLIWWMVALGLGAVDTLSLLAAFAVAYFVRFGASLPFFRDAPSKLDFYVSVIGWALPIWLVIFFVCHLYDVRILFAGFREYTRVAVACSVGTLAIIVISFFYELETMARAWLVLVWAGSIAAVWVGRFLFRRLVWGLRSRGHLRRPTIVIGANEEGRALTAQLMASTAAGAEILGFVDCGTAGDLRQADGPPILGGLSDLEHLVELYAVEDLVIATTAVSRQDLLDLYSTFGHDERVQLRLSSGLFEILTTGIQVQDVGGIPLMSVHRVRITGLDAILKAALDFAVASIGLLVLSPLLLVLAVVVRLDTPGPILFRRRVLGRNGRQFDAFKFRTMIYDRRVRRETSPFADRRGVVKTAHDPRVTRTGKFLRRTSLDELPQLINVLRGEMSLVGPRMINPDEVDRFGKWRLNLLTVKPGITGPWQVRGRATLPYEERVRLNMEYIRDYSIWRDLEILLRTVPAVLRGTGAF